ncbi:MAG: glycosyltransferase, partial [Ignavibacteria bacterium]|nr:glycosyltransferase [Ignavibacteria bacterium]
ISVFLRLNLFLPDAKVGWLPYAVRKGIEIIRTEKIDAIISSGPPHTCHLIARNIKRRTGVKWIADFRDPWTDIDYYSGMRRTKLAEWLDSKLERSVLKEADAIISAGEGYLSILKSKGIKNHYEVITNGFDPDDFVNVPKIETKKFIITYTGNMPRTRNPKSLWQALNELIEENSDFKNNFEFWFAGVLDEEVRAEIETQSFFSHFKNFGYVNHQKAIELVFNSDLLIMIVNQVKTANEILPGKIFEYVATGNPIVVIGPENGVAAKLLNEVQQGKAFDYEKLNELKEYIIKMFTDWKDGKTNRLQTEGRDYFTREKITERLANNLDRIVHG